MRILYAALLFMMMLVGAPAALAAPQISVGLVTGQFTAELASETDFTAQTVVNGNVRKEFCLKRAVIILMLQTAALMPTGRSLATLCCALRQTA